MRFTTHQAALADALAWSGATLPRRLEQGSAGIRLSVAGSRLEIAARDDEGSHLAELEVENASPGAVLAPGPFLRSIVSSLPAGEVTLEVEEGSRISIRAGRSSYTANALPLETWPARAEALEPVGTLEAEQLRAMLASVRHPVDDASPFGEIAGVHLEASAGELRLVGASRQVLEVARSSWPGSRFEVTLPARRLSSALAGISGPAEFAWAGSLFGISGEGRTALLRTYAAPFPPYGRYLRPAAEDASWIEADADELRAALRRIGLVLSEPELAVLLEADAGGIRIAALDTSSAKRGEERLDAEASGPVRLAVRARYLIDALGVLSGGRARLGLAGRGKPITVRAAEAEAEAYLGVVMPMQEPPYLAELERGAA